jgi:hypothetical protein
VKKLLIPITLVSLFLACRQTSPKASSEKEKDFAAQIPAGAQIAANVPPNFCAPLGDPISGGAGLSGANAFALCQTGGSVNEDRGAHPSACHSQRRVRFQELLWPGLG